MPPSPDPSDGWLLRRRTLEQLLAAKEQSLAAMTDVLNGLYMELESSKKRLDRQVAFFCFVSFGRP